MAIMLPEIPRECTPNSLEELMFDSLKRLPDDYYVFHSFTIVNVVDGIINESETDFVVFNPVANAAYQSRSFQHIAVDVEKGIQGIVFQGVFRPIDDGVELGNRFTDGSQKSFLFRNDFFRIDMILGDGLFPTVININSSDNDSGGNADAFHNRFGIVVRNRLTGKFRNGLNFR